MAKSLKEFRKSAGIILEQSSGDEVTKEDVLGKTREYFLKSDVILNDGGWESIVPKGSKVRPRPFYNRPGEPPHIIGDEVLAEIPGHGTSYVHIKHLGMRKYDHQKHEKDTVDRLNQHINAHGGKIKLHIPGYHKKGQYIEVSGAIHHSGNHKGDMSFIDSNGKHIHFIDIKKMYHQGNITPDYDVDHPEVRRVVDEFNRTKKNTEVFLNGKDPKNKELIGKSLFGVDYGGKSHGINNIQSIITGDMNISAPESGDVHTLTWTGEAHHNTGELPHAKLRARVAAGRSVWRAQGARLQVSAYKPKGKE